MLKRICTLIVAAAALAAPSANAQYVELAQQLPNLISPALSGSLNYKGFVELSGTAGIGSNRANFVGISTTQGFMYANWFYMGVGVGVDVAMTNVNGNAPYSGDYDPTYNGWPSYYYHSSSTTKAMIPVFTDFRFYIGPLDKLGGYVDLKLGASWLIGDSYLRMQHGRLGGATQFYFKPSVGLRIPTNPQNPKQAVNVGLTYQLTTANNNFYYWDANDLTLSSLGFSVSYEW